MACRARALWHCRGVSPSPTVDPTRTRTSNSTARSLRAPGLHPQPHRSLSTPQYELCLLERCTVGYFEVSIGAPAGGKGATNEATPSASIDCIAIGLGSDSFPLTGRQPGWDMHSFGYHSDDGRLFHGSGTRSQPFGPRFAVGDTVGCGISLTTRQIFYTHNGLFLGVAFVAKPSQLPLYPIVGLDSHATVNLNFGQRPFAFDLDSLPLTLRRPPPPEHPSPHLSALRLMAMRFLS